MKPALFFVFIIACVNAVAQQPPGEATRQPAQAPRPSPPMAPAPAAAQLNNEELTALLRAQTAAIKSLRSKLDSLEQRVEKIERVRR
jgi:3-oxoacyl-ACP reductase-like protein